SVSSKRSTKAPAFARANSQLLSATKILPTWSRPVGLGARRTRALIDVRYLVEQPPEGVGDRVAAVAAEGARRDLHAGGRLAALVFRGGEHAPDAVDCGAVVAAGDDVVARHLALDQAFEDAVELGIGRQRVLVGLVG